MLPTHRSSFLVRCWRSNDAAWQVEVEHIQAGRSARLDSLEALVRWIERVASEPAAPGDESEGRP